MPVRLLIFATIFGAALATSAVAGQTVWDGVYTSAQATRGAAIFASQCSACHNDTLPDRIAPASFMNALAEDTLKSLFTVVKTTMPRTAPGSLTDAAYTDIVAYVLQLNAFPPGAEELGPGALDTIRVEAKGGPEPVPNFSLVRTSGCLAQTAGTSWTLTNATDPVRTRDPGAETDAKGDNTPPKSGGGHTFRLLQAYPAESERGHKVEAKGFLIRASNEERITVTSLRTIAANCEN